MNRIAHLALKVENLEQATEFYEKVFGFKEVETRKTRDPVSRHMTDGQLDFTLMKYDEGTRSAGSPAAGEKPCIHHFAIEVDDVAGCTAGLRKYGCEIISDPGVIPVKFRAPDGDVAELVPACLRGAALDKYVDEYSETMGRILKVGGIRVVR